MERRAGGSWKQGAGCEAGGQAGVDRQLLMLREGSLSRVSRPLKSAPPLLHTPLPIPTAAPLTPLPSQHGSRSTTDRQTDRQTGSTLAVGSSPGPLAKPARDTLQASPGPGQAFVPAQLRLFAFPCHPSHGKPWRECISLTIL